MKPSLEQLRSIVENQLCHRCGSCSGICPQDVIDPDDEYYPAWAQKEDDCTDCGLCVQVCPGREFSFPEFCQRILGKDADLRKDHGHFLKAFLGYSTDPEVRSLSTSGGLGRQLPLFLMKTGRVKGAVSVRSDPDVGWKPRAFVARSPEDLRQASLSKYPACSVNHLFKELNNDPGPFVFTGIPCQVHGLRKMAALSPKIDRKIALTIGLFCHSCLDHPAVREMLEYYRVDERDLAQVIYRYGKLPGHVRAQTRDGRWVGLPYPKVPLNGYRPNAAQCLTFLFKFYSPMRCRLCIDATAEFADISISDPWIEGWAGVARLHQGYNFVLARTQRGLRVLEEAQQAGAIALEPLPESAVELCQARMVRKKRARAFYNMERRSRQGRPNPEYGLPKTWGPLERARAAMHVAGYAAAERPALRRRLVHFLLSAPGRYVVGLVFLGRRVLHAWERLKVAVTGRNVLGRVR